jgi:hypothetical protein
MSSFLASTPTKAHRDFSPVDVLSNAAFLTINPGLVSITVRQIPGTYLRNNISVGDADTVKVRGLLFVDPGYDNTNYPPGNAVAFIMVASRISK